MEIIWGYTPSETLPNSKVIGEEISEIKQMYSALLFKTGVLGFSVKLEEIAHKPLVKLVLVIDSQLVFETTISPDSAGEFSFNLDELVIPKIKIEVGLLVLKGLLEISISSIGTGMGFQKIDDEFVPTNHLALGVIGP